MTVNKYKIKISPNDRYINIPIQIDTDLLGRDDLIDEFEDETIEKVINPIEDFELTRFAHKDWVENNQLKSSIEHKFFFYNREQDIGSISNTNSSVWVNDYNFTNNPNYIDTCFTEADVYYNSNSFRNSFFKLDLYDTIDTETQKLYLTIIIPTQQGKTRLSSTEPFVDSSGPIQGPDLPDLQPDSPSGARNASERMSQKVYEDELNRLIIEKENNPKKYETTNIHNRAYKVQLQYELDEVVRKVEESRNEHKKDSLTTTTPLITPSITPSLSSTIPSDVNLLFDSYEVTFVNCNSETLTKYISVNLWNTFFNWPTYGYSTNFDFVCYEITSANTSTIIPDPPLSDYIQSSYGFVNNDCGCITPTPTPTNSVTSTPRPTLTPTPTPTTSPPPAPTPTASYIPAEDEGNVNNNPNGIGSGGTPSLVTAPANAQIKIPDFILDYVGDKEGYFIYWLKNPNYLVINDFYMSAKFFNAKTGQFIRMMNQPQNSIPTRYNFNNADYFYYKILMDYDNYEYEVNNTQSNQRVGTSLNEIKWYEYVNPS